MTNQSKEPILSGGYEPDVDVCTAQELGGILITQEMLEAGEKALREHSEEFDDGTSLGAYDYVVLAILSAALRRTGSI